MKYKTLFKSSGILFVLSLIFLSLSAKDVLDKYPSKCIAVPGNRNYVSNPDLPKFEKSAAELQRTFDSLTTEANKKLKELAALSPRKRNFQSTVYAFENIMDLVNTAYLRAFALKEAHPDKAVMDKATELCDSYAGWLIDTYNNGGVYKVLKAYANTNPRLTPDEKKLMTDMITTFKRNGLTDAGVVNPDVLRLQKEINDLGTDINQTVIAANSTKNYFTQVELDGLSADQLASLSQEGESYVVMSGNISTLQDVIMSYAIKEETRKRTMLIVNSRAKENIHLITSLVGKRLELAKILGYNCWADYKTEINMAKTGAVASTFANTIATKLHTALEKELLAESNYIIPGVNDSNNQVDVWDVFFFRRLYQTQELSVDYYSLKKYFPYKDVLDGMLRTYEQLFGLKIEFVKNPEAWHPDVQLLKISNNTNNRRGLKNETLGYVYLDMFPRLETGKFNHFECTGLAYGKTMGNGSYRKPIAAMICNFSVDSDGNPENMLFTDIGTMFHEFGHALHVVLGKARFASQTGFCTPMDFVEVPSTMSEQWLLDPVVFKTIAASNPELTDEFIHNTISSIKNSQLATVGTSYGRQFGANIVDFTLHMLTDASQIPSASSANNLITMTADAMTWGYLPYPEGSAYVSSFLHILSWGYDSGYYGYAWANSIVAELAVLFDESPNGYMDHRLGMRYREEILEPGASRDVNESTMAFTGRPLDPEYKAYLKRLGLE